MYENQTETKVITVVKNPILRWRRRERSDWKGYRGTFVLLYDLGCI